MKLSYTTMGLNTSWDLVLLLGKSFFAPKIYRKRVFTFSIQIFFTMFSLFFWKKKDELNYETHHNHRFHHNAIPKVYTYDPRSWTRLLCISGGGVAALKRTVGCPILPHFFEFSLQSLGIVDLVHKELGVTLIPPVQQYRRRRWTPKKSKNQMSKGKQSPHYGVNIKYLVIWAP